MYYLQNYLWKKYKIVQETLKPEIHHVYNFWAMLIIGILIDTAVMTKLYSALCEYVYTVNTSNK